jgi:acyl-CoA thioester hydrolase
MPLAHTRVFRVRAYECDAYGHVNNANYLRYMQEAALDASAAAGYGPERYAAIGRSWLIRETEIEYLRPLVYGDRIAVNTWVADFQRVRSRRAYAVRHAESGEPVAEGWTDWVFIDLASGRPTPIDAELIAAFWPEGAPAPAPRRPRFPAAPPAPPGVFRVRRQVQWADIDSVGHVNNAVYLSYVEDSAMQIMATYNWPAERMIAQGFGIVTRRHQIEYRQAAVLGDELEIATWASGVRRSTGTRHYVITRARDGALVCRVHTLVVWIDLATGRPISIPSEFRAAFAPNIVAAETSAA